MNVLNHGKIKKLKTTKQQRISWKFSCRVFQNRKEKDNRFKLNTPYGKVTSRKGSKVIQVSNEQDIINQLEQRGFNNYVRVTKKLSQSDIKKISI